MGILAFSHTPISIKEFSALVIPAAYHSAKAHAGGVDPDALRILPFPQTTQVVDGSDLDDASGHGLKIISRGTAILLLLVYVAYLFFQVSNTIISQRSRNVCL